MPPNPDTLVELTSFRTEFEAATAAAALEDAGIEVAVFQGNVNALGPAIGFAPAAVHVRRRDLDRARLALVEVLTHPPRPADALDAGPPPADEPPPPAPEKQLPYGPDSHYFKSGNLFFSGLLWTAIAAVLALAIIAGVLFLVTATP